MRSGSGRLFRHPGSWDRNRSRMTVHQRLAHWSPTAPESTSANFHLVVVQLTKYQRLAVTQTSSRPRCPLRSCRLSPRTNRTYCCNRVISRLRGAIFGSYPYPPVLRTISKASSDMVEDGHPPPTADLPLAKAAIYLLPITMGATLVRSPPRLVRLAT